MEKRNSQLKHEQPMEQTSVAQVWLTVNHNFWQISSMFEECLSHSQEKNSEKLTSTGIL